MYIHVDTSMSHISNQHTLELISIAKSTIMYTYHLLGPNVMVYIYIYI